MEFPMFRLMKSDKITLDHTVEGHLSAYHQSEVRQFRTFRAARAASEVANNDGTSRCYVLNASGQEYYDGQWID